jgi:hypothetical protein
VWPLESFPPVSTPRSWKRIKIPFAFSIYSFILLSNYSQEVKRVAAQRGSGRGDPAEALPRPAGRRDQLRRVAPAADRRLPRGERDEGETTQGEEGSLREERHG